MAKAWELLDKAYTLVSSGYVSQAQYIIQKIITHNPQNIEAWELYINTLETPTELEQLKGTVESIWDAGAQEMDYLDANRRYILRRIDDRMESM